MLRGLTALIRLLAASLLLQFSSAALATTGASAPDCSRAPEIELELGGAATHLIDEGPMRDKYGKTAEKCAFNFPMGSLSEAAGDCRVAGMTLLGSDPAPHLVSVYRSFENVTREREVESEKGGEGWRLSGDLLACSGEVCDLDGFVQVELIRADLELSGMADCPWSHVVARLDLAQ